jgi:hypothetical protein
VRFGVVAITTPYYDVQYVFVGTHQLSARRVPAVPPSFRWRRGGGNGARLERFRRAQSSTGSEWQDKFVAKESVRVVKPSEEG